MASSMPASFEDEPLSPPPPGQLPDFVHPPSRAPEVYIAAAVCLSLILIFAVMRFYAKAMIRKNRTWDDLTCTLGLLAAISFISTTVATVSIGAYGMHEWDITLRDFSKELLVLSLIVGSIYGPCIWLVKISLFVLYLEIFGVLRWLRYLATIGMIVTGLFYLGSMIAVLVICAPRHGHTQIAYLTALETKQCSKMNPLSITIGAVSFVSDLYLVILPLPAVWSLQLPLRRKVGVSAMFLTGLVACIASILGLHFRIQEGQSEDNTWVIIPAWLTGMVEITAGILVCCMPTTAAVFGQLGGLFSTLITTSRGGLRSWTRFATSSHHEKLGSTSNLHQSHHHSSSQNAGRTPYEMQKPWSGPENVWSEYQAEPERHFDSPSVESRIRKSTKVEVTRELGRH